MTELPQVSMTQMGHAGLSALYYAPASCLGNLLLRVHIEHNPAESAVGASQFAGSCGYVFPMGNCTKEDYHES